MLLHEKNIVTGDTYNSMKIKAVLFDLDGTLLPMDQNDFIKDYFKRLIGKVAPYGYDPALLEKAIWKGSAAMVKNDGSRTNKDVFFDAFVAVMGEGIRQHFYVFDEFYQNEFDQVRHVCGNTPDADKVVKLVRSLGLTAVLATNPLFPPEATLARVRWAGLDADDFSLITTYDNSSYCKPNPAYYLNICETVGISPEECLMVGNDVGDDMIAGSIGMKTFLLEDCLINPMKENVDNYSHGSFPELEEKILKLSEIT